MIDEIDLLGVYVPAALVCGMVAAILVYALRGTMQRLPAHRLLWHPSLLELALFVVFWWGLSLLADAFL